MQAQRSKLEQHIVELKHDLTTARLSFVKSEEHVQKLTEELHRSHDDVTALDSRLRAIVAELKNSQSQHSEATADQNALRTQLVALTTDNTQLRKALSEAQTNAANLANAKSAAEQNAHSLQSQLSASQSKLAVLEQEYEQISADLRAVQEDNETLRNRPPTIVEVESPVSHSHSYTLTARSHSI